MSQPQESQHPLVCPRCRSAAIQVLSNSPIAGVWIIYGCKICLYAWRSTEAEENTNPDKYPEAFRLRPEDIPKFLEVPAIPPLRKS